jgi:hypothetical protein
MLRFLLSILILVCPRVSASIDVVKLGGLFSPFLNSNVSTRLVEHEAAFLMAIDAINNKGDGVFDDILPNTQLKYALRGGNTPYDIAQAVTYLLHDVNYSVAGHDLGSDVIVGAFMDSVVATTAISLTSSAGVVLAQGSSTSAALDDAFC